MSLQGWGWAGGWSKHFEKHWWELWGPKSREPRTLTAKHRRERRGGREGKREGEGKRERRGWRGGEGEREGKRGREGSNDETRSYLTTGKVESRGNMGGETPLQTLELSILRPRPCPDVGRYSPL